MRNTPNSLASSSGQLTIFSSICAHDLTVIAGYRPHSECFRVCGNPKSWHRFSGPGRLTRRESLPQNSAQELIPAIASAVTSTAANKYEVVQKSTQVQRFASRRQRQTTSRDRYQAGRRWRVAVVECQLFPYFLLPHRPAL